MTGPVAHGFPDFNKQLLTSDRVYVNDLDVIADAFTKNVGYVGNTQWIAVHFFAVLQGWTLNFRFYADAALSVFLDSYVLEFVQADALHLSLPVYGPYLKIEGAASAAGGEYTLRAWNVAGLVFPFADSSKYNVLISDLNRNAAGGGGTAQVDATTVYPGPAVLSINTASTNWTASLRAVNSAGVETRLGFVANSLEPHSFYLTGQPTRVVLSNFAAGAFTFDTLLVAKPLVG